MMSTVIGGARLPHAPPFFTLPETEAKKVVEHVRDVAADIGKKLRALEPDLWIIFSNDHAEQFFTPRRRRSPSMSVARRAAISPAGNPTGRFQARSLSRSCASSTGRT